MGPTTTLHRTSRIFSARRRTLLTGAEQRKGRRLGASGLPFRENKNGFEMKAPAPDGFRSRAYTSGVVKFEMHTQMDWQPSVAVATRP
jgi:hypothetical protein